MSARAFLRGEGDRVTDCSCLACQVDLAVACKQTEARIRADARRFLLAELEALTGDLETSNTRPKALERLRSLVESQPPTEPPGEPLADSDGPQTGLPGWARRRMEQDEARIEALQAEVRRLRAQRSAA